MDRKVFKIPFIEKGPTKLPCPACGNGILMVKEGTFFSNETNLSAGAHSHEAWDPDWIEYLFSCLLVCSTCADTVSCSGTGGVTEYYFDNVDGQPDRDYQSVYFPKFFVPYLNIFDTPDETPVLVDEELGKSFSLLFCDASSAANHVRVSLEHLLTHLKVPRYRTKNGNRTFLSLHNRIELLPSKYEDIKELFIAVKWLGNAGSHSKHDVTRDDVLDSYELMDELLSGVFSKKRKRAASLAKKINKKKGPK